MEKKIVFSCSCFIDQSVWFVNSFYPSQKFDSFVCVNGLLSEKIFIYKKDFRSVSYDVSIQFINEIVVCCLECFEFILTYFSTVEKMFDVFNKIDCSYVTFDYFCYDSDIFVGNDQFMLSNLNLTHDEREKLYFKTLKKVEKIFKKKPERKSCFTSLEKYKYECLCSRCKEIFNLHFVKKLFCIQK